MAATVSTPSAASEASADPRLSDAALRRAFESARGTDALARAAAQARGQVQASFLRGGDVLTTTRLYAQINDLVTEHLVRRGAAELALDLGQACWLAFGSQGRSEQTPATDQDNGWVFCAGDVAAARARWLELGQRVNEALAACGYTLCRGRVMAGQPGCCLTLGEWCDRFDAWLEHGAPEDLLNACIYFDLRGLVGRLDLAAALRQRFTARAAALPRFLKQMADNALRHVVPLDWFGRVRASRLDGLALFDLKMTGTAIFVETSRLYALANAITVTGTAARLQAVALALGVPAHESAAWQAGFVQLQRLRLQSQDASMLPAGNPNLVELGALSATDQQILKQGLRGARLLQQRAELDYWR